MLRTPPLSLEQRPGRFQLQGTAAVITRAASFFAYLMILETCCRLSKARNAYWLFLHVAPNCSVASQATPPPCLCTLYCNTARLTSLNRHPRFLASSPLPPYSPRPFSGLFRPGRKLEGLHFRFCSCSVTPPHYECAILPPPRQRFLLARLIMSCLSGFTHSEAHWHSRVLKRPFTPT